MLALYYYKLAVFLQIGIDHTSREHPFSDVNNEMRLACGCSEMVVGQLCAVSPLSGHGSVTGLRVCRSNGDANTANCHCIERETIVR